MEREIKFRMWNCVKSDPSKSKMFYETDQVMDCLKQQIHFNSNTMLGYDHCADGNVFMQYTGLKDKNGVEAFEKDLAKVFIEVNHGFAGKHTKEVICEIRFDTYFICGWEFNPLGEARVYAFKDVCKNFNDTGCKNFEIIGNTFTNPELLK